MIIYFYALCVSFGVHSVLFSANGLYNTHKAVERSSLFLEASQRCRCPHLVRPHSNCISTKLVSSVEPLHLLVTVCSKMVLLMICEEHNLCYLGFNLLLTTLCVRSLWKIRKYQPKAAWTFLTYVFVLFALGTVGNAANAKIQELAFVYNRNYPGGPSNYLVEQSTVNPLTLTGTASYIIASWMEDGLLVSLYLLKRHQKL